MVTKNLEQGRCEPGLGAARAFRRRVLSIVDGQVQSAAAAALGRRKDVDRRRQTREGDHVNGRRRLWRSRRRDVIARSADEHYAPAATAALLLVVQQLND